MTGPFKFDTNLIPDNRNNKINHIRTVPAEIVAGILSSVLTKPRVALEMRLVNKTFSQLAC
ncbi:MAG: hypothetical protein MUE75_13690, partial [Algoriphagus sp.]|nr:hypothetical protein [Algoriphagus sp.]